MAEYVEVDVRGLSCPEPVLLAMDAMQDHPGKLIRVLGDEAHTRKNIEKMLEYENRSGQTTVRPDGCFEIVSGVMREKKPYQVLTFHTTDAAMEMESFCKQNGIAGRLVPVPRRLSAGCGIAWRMEAEVYAQYQTVIADCGIEIEQSEALVF